MGTTYAGRHLAARRVAAATAAAVLATLLLPGCSSGGEERSTEKFCATYDQQKKEFLDRYSAIDPHPTDGMAALTASSWASSRSATCR